MLELIVAIAGGALLIAGLTWRSLFHGTGIPGIRALLGDPDPRVRAAALDQLDSSLDEYGPELVNLARRERAPEVHDALVRLVERFAEGDPALWASPDLRELRERAFSRAGGDPALEIERLLNWPAGRAAELIAHIEHALFEEVTWLRVLNSFGAFELKTMQETK